MSSFSIYWCFSLLVCMLFFDTQSLHANHYHGSHHQTNHYGGHHNYHHHGENSKKKHGHKKHGYAPHRLVNKFKDLSGQKLNIKRDYIPLRGHFPLNKDSRAGYRKHESGFGKTDFFQKNKKQEQQVHHHPVFHQNEDNHHGPYRGPGAHIFRRANAVSPQQPVGVYHPVHPHTHKSQDSKVHDYLGTKKDGGATKTREDKLNEARRKATFGTASLETNADGYDQNIKYHGGKLWTGDNGHQKAFDKGEGYKKKAYQGKHKSSDYAGNAVKLKTETDQANIIKYNVTHETNYRNQYKNEDHGGSYKGQKFSVGFDAKDVQGGFYGSKHQNKYNGIAKDGTKYAGQATKGGHYEGGDEIKLGDYSKEGRYSEYPQQNPRFQNGMANAGFGATPHFGKKTKDGKHFIVVSDKLPSSGHGKVNGAERGGSYSKDGDFRQYGANFLGKDYFGKVHHNEGRNEAQEDASLKNAYSNGNYRNVEAKGQNKNVEFQGDYQKNEKKHVVEHKAKHGENYFEFGIPEPYRVKHQEYFANYKGKNYKGNYEEQGKHGKYHDQELQAEYDQNKHQKKYKGESFGNGFSGETAGIFYTGEKNVAEKTKSQYRDPASNKL